MTLGGLAMVNPVVDGHDEFSRMIPEKTRAFADASSILISLSAQIGQEMTRIVVDGVELAADATTVVLASRSPGVILAAQADVALAWVRQITARSGAMCLLVLEAQGAVMAPIHQAARDNVERLRR